MNPGAVLNEPSPSWWGDYQDMLKALVQLQLSMPAVSTALNNGLKQTLVTEPVSRFLQMLQFGT